MNKKSVRILFVLGFFCGAAQAQTLVISDIDDTIKISHVLDKVDAVLNGPEIENHFLGMSALYQRILKTQTETRFAYVSNAPKQIMESSHQAFLRFNQFPKGGLHLRENPWDEEFKLTKIRSLLTKQRPKKLILIGDNGEKDTLIYAQIKKEYPQISVLAFIHQIYSIHNPFKTGSPLQVGQMGFVTSIDLAEKLRQKNGISQADLESLIQTIVPQIMREDGDLDSGEMAFPQWLDCRDYFALIKLRLVPSYSSFFSIRWPWEDSPESLSFPDLTQEYHRLLKLRCSTHSVNR